MTRGQKFLGWVFIAVFLYVAVSGVVFAFRHPELTDTQRILRLADALMWR